MATLQKLTPCLWFDTEAEDAAKHWCSIFKNSQILSVSHYTEGMPRPAGSVLTVEFELDGMKLLGLNGGPEFSFSEAVSLQISCDDQAEVDHFWDRLLEGGEPSQCGWLKDKFGFSWQVIPRRLPELLADPDPGRATRVGQAMMGMVKIDIAELERAADAG